MELLQQRIKLLKTTDRRVQLISCPYSNSDGAAVAATISRAYEYHEDVCYYPDEDHPQSLDVSWLETWMAICDNTKRTGGTVFVVYRTDGKGQYGCDVKGAGSLDGQAQEGEVKYAIGKGCSVEWVSKVSEVADAVERAAKARGPNTLIPKQRAAEVTLDLSSVHFPEVPTLPQSTVQVRPGLISALKKRLLRRRRPLTTHLFVGGLRAKTRQG